MAEKQAEQKALQQKFQQAQELCENFNQAEETQQQLQELEEQLPEQAEKKSRLVQAQKIEKLRPTYERVQELELLQKKQNQEADENQQQAEALETRYAEYQRITADFENSKSEWAAKEKELQSLESFRPLVEQREQLTTQKAKFVEQQTQQQTQLTLINEK